MFGEWNCLDICICLDNVRFISVWVRWDMKFGKIGGCWLVWYCCLECVNGCVLFLFVVFFIIVLGGECFFV